MLCKSGCGTSVGPSLNPPQSQFENFSRDTVSLRRYKMSVKNEPEIYKKNHGRDNMYVENLIISNENSHALL